MSEMVGPQRHAIESINTDNTPKKIQSLNEDNCIEFGYYLHRNKLGEGGFGKVRLATHLKTGHKVAVKIMNKAKLGADLCRVRVEINSLKVLNHENIAKLLQVIETKDTIYLILEYCCGGELFDYLVSKSKLSENESKTIIKDLANALAFIHRKGFAHRDLKPENILFDENHKIKLIDFGLAANSRDNNNSLTHLSTCCGSPAYAAPELLQGLDYSGPAVDVWSTGILLYALLVGKLPFDDENIGALYKKIQTGFYRMPEWLSRDAKDLIKSMLKTNPNERITINEILLHPWLCPNIGVLNRSQGIQILKPNLDEEVFYKCHRLFPHLSTKDLRENILLQFGYQTATYWLIKMDSNSTATSTQPMNINTIAGSPYMNRDPIRRARSKSLNELKPPENDIRPKLIGVKRKLMEPQVLRSIENPKTNDKIENKDPKQLGFKFEFDINSSPNAKIAIPFNFQNLTPKPKQTPKLADIQSPPHSGIPVKKARLFNNANDSTQRLKSPLQNLILKNISPKTPVNRKIESTPKKSLLKRILETATPARSHNPRTINTSMTSKNITLTKFIEPQKCIEKLIETLTAKGIQCKQKEFSLRCVLSTNNVIVLSFNLEICKFHNWCVIQRKRLKGDAWNYKKVCEEILRISNE